MSGSPVAKVIHSFGRAEKVDRAALARLVSSNSRFLTPEETAAAAHGAEVEILDCRRLGGTWTLDRVWERLGIGAAIAKAAAGRRLDGAGVERVVFALVALRALKPGSKLAGTDVRRRGRRRSRAARRCQWLPAQGRSPRCTHRRRPRRTPGGSALPLSVTMQLLAHVRPPHRPRRIAGLTDREADVLRVLATGASNLKIAETLRIGEATVKTHVARLLAKTGSRDRVQLVVAAYEAGFVGNSTSRPATGTQRRAR